MGVFVSFTAVASYAVLTWQGNLIFWLGVFLITFGVRQYRRGSRAVRVVEAHPDASASLPVSPFPVSGHDTISTPSSLLPVAATVTSEDVQRRRLFSDWLGGYSRQQVDEFTTRVAGMLAAYENGNVTNPHLTSSEVKGRRFRLAWKGYKPDQVDEYVAQTVDALMAYETTLATLALPKPDPGSEPTPMLTALGSFLGATAASVALHVQSVSADDGFVLSVSSYVLTAVVALFGGGLGYFLQPAKRKGVAGVLGVVGWLLGVLAGLSLTLSLMVGSALQGL